MDLRRRQHHTLMISVSIKKINKKFIEENIGDVGHLTQPDRCSGSYKRTFIIERFACFLYLHQLSVDGISLIRKTTKRKPEKTSTCLGMPPI